ncbi:MAG: recombination mediator RecR [Candidatus Marinimicrobia bacterium]|nr:recombination mediator RecR [Candidatus Neomarinimicrobiota bacterium]
MSQFPEPVNELIEKLTLFPGIGKKSARRLVFYLLGQSRDVAVDIAKAIVNIKDKIYTCSQCYNISDSDPCHICKDPKREQEKICVVQDARDVFAFEQTGSYRGLYHVLGGVLSPLNGVGPEDLNIESLLPRLENVEEVILAINPTRDGETTAIYLAKLIKKRNIKVTRVAQGLPMGIDIEYADDVTLTKALEGRTNL